MTTNSEPRMIGWRERFADELADEFEQVAPGTRRAEFVAMVLLAMDAEREYWERSRRERVEG